MLYYNNYVLYLVVLSLGASGKKLKNVRMFSQSLTWYWCDLCIILRPEVEATYCTNGDPVTSRSLSPGVYGLSNERLDSPWKKVTRGKSRFSECVSHLQSGTVDEDECERQLFELLCDQTWSVFHNERREDKEKEKGLWAC